MLPLFLATSALLTPHQASRTRVASIVMSEVEKSAATGPDVSLAASQAKAELRAAQSAAAAAWRKEEKAALQAAEQAAANQAALAAMSAKVESLQAEVDAAPKGGSMPAFVLGAVSGAAVAWAALTADVTMPSLPTMKFELPAVQMPAPKIDVSRVTKSLKKVEVPPMPKLDVPKVDVPTLSLIHI